MHTKTSFISQVLECPLIILVSCRIVDAHSRLSVVCIFTHMHKHSFFSRTTMFYTLSHYLVSLRIPLFLSFTHQHTHTHSHSQLIAFPFFLQRDLWWGECWRQAITMSCLNSSVRQSGRGGSGDIRRPFPATRPPLTCFPPPALPSPMLTPLQWRLGLPHGRVFISIVGQRRFHFAFPPFDWMWSAEN